MFIGLVENASIRKCCSTSPGIPFGSSRWSEKQQLLSGLPLVTAAVRFSVSNPPNDRTELQHHSIAAHFNTVQLHISQHTFFSEDATYSRVATARATALVTIPRTTVSHGYGNCHVATHREGSGETNDETRSLHLLSHAARRFRDQLSTFAAVGSELSTVARRIV